MPDNVLIVAGQVATLFILMGVGFGLWRSGRFSGGTVSQISFLQVNIVVPCLIFNSFRIERDARVVREMGLAALATFLCYIASILLVSALFKRQADEKRAVLRFGSIYSNVAFMGFPLIEAVYGRDALVYAAVSLAVFTVFQWTHGVALMGGGLKSVTAAAIIKSPGVIALLLGFVFFFVGYDVVDDRLGPVADALTFIANMNTPLALIVLGAQMAASDYRKLLSDKTLYGACALRLVALPLLALLIMAPLGLPRTVYHTLAVLCATPAAGLTSGLAVKFSRDIPTAAQFVTLSTLLSIVTLPLFAAAVQAFVK